MKRLPLILPLLALCALALPATAAPTAEKISKVSQAKNYNPDDTLAGGDGKGGFGGGAGIGHWFDGKKKTDGSDMWGGGGTYLASLADGGYCILDFTADAADGYFVTDVRISQCGAFPYSISWSDDGDTWNAVSGAQSVSYVGEGVYGVNKLAKYVKIVFDQTGGWSLNICEIEVWGYEPVKATKISAVSQAKNYNPDGTLAGGDGKGGFGGGAGIGHWFDGKKKTDGSDMWGGGGTYLASLADGGYCILDFTDDMANGYYVTDVRISQCGAFPYSISYSNDGETWTDVPNAQNVSYVGEGVYGVNKIAKYVKILFNQTGGWSLNICEIEVWGMDPDDITCFHENVTDDSPAWVRYQDPTCTQNAREERYCPDCQERFEREALLTALGHIYVATLIEPGTITSYGSGEVNCAREDCDFHIEFDGDPIDLSTLGGEPVSGVAQYTDLTTYSTGGTDGGISPSDLIDGVWADSWNGYWFAQGLGTNEWIQFAFGTPVEITKIEYSVLNQDQTVYFSKYDPATGEETLLKSIVIVKDTSDGAPGYQRKTLYFFGGEDANETVTLDALRMRVGDVLDEQGNVAIAYVGTQYGRPYHTCVLEVHPYGTISGAGKKDPGKPMFILMQ